MKRKFLILSALYLFLGINISYSIKSSDNNTKILRFPAIGNDSTIIFSYAGDLYSTTINGGDANKLTSHIGYEMFPRVSPDGKTIAFTGQYDGNTEVYTMPIYGGEPIRVTYTATLERDNIGDRMGPNNIVMCWTPDGKDIVYRSRQWAYCGSRGVLMRVSHNGGTSEQLPLTEGGFCSFSNDGKKLALNRMFREFRTWKHYRGGQADDIWLADIKTGNLENLTNSEGQDIFPMFINDEIYFISDRDSIMNLFVYNIIDKKTEKLTNFDNYDIKYPSHSKDFIIFENGGDIYTFRIKDRELKRINIFINDENKFARSRWEDASKRITDYSLSKDASNILVTARGEIFEIPVKEGATINLSQTIGAQERDAKYSPDGIWYAYFSDISGEYELYIAKADRSGMPIKLTSGNKTYKNGIEWSPNSDYIYFTTELREIIQVSLQGKERILFNGDYGGIRGVNISPSGDLIAFVTASDNKINVVNILEINSGKIHQVTDNWYNSSSPVFSQDGKYLYLTSARELSAQYASNEWNAFYNYKSYIFSVPLEELNKRALQECLVSLPIEPGNYRLIKATDDFLLFQDRGTIKSYNIKNKSAKESGKGALVSFTPDNKKALYLDKGNLSVIPLAETLNSGENIDRNGLKVFVDFQEEWKQIFDETWRVYRDGFYVKNMHGKDWEKIYNKYAVLLPYVKHRHDLTYLIGEMISELNVGHAYVTSGDAPNAERIDMGLLGAKFSKDKSGYFKIDKIYKGENWSEKLRSPLTEYGLNITPGMYILSVNNVSLKDKFDIYETLVGRGNSKIELLINDKPMQDGARKVYVKTISSEIPLAYYEWVQNNIALVDKLSGGEIGYIHVPDMSTAGLDEFTRLFYPQLNKRALIIDDRMNGGGNVSPIIIEKLSRIVHRMSMSRNGAMPSTIPDAAHFGPKVVLVDKYSMSDGDLFPYSFQKLKLGKVIGMPTWGGIVGISGSKNYLDKQDVRTPFFTSYSVDSGDWIIENIGVFPDILIDNNPFDEYKGVDKQLENAVEVLMTELKDFKRLPDVPNDPVR